MNTPFEKAFAANTEGLEFLSVGLCATCKICQSDFDEDDADKFAEKISDGKIFDEGGISRQGCDTCGMSLQATLFSAHAVSKETQEVIHLCVCEDCVAFIANAQLPEHWEG
jgi:hypothetical protein